MVNEDIQTASGLSLPPPPAGISPLTTAASTFFPGVAAFVEYWNSRMQGRRERQVYSFCNDAIQCINSLCEQSANMAEQLKGKVDAEHLWSEEFLGKFAAATEEHVRNNDELKRQYLIDFISAYSLIRRPDRSLVEMFWDLIRAISGTEVALLDKLYLSQRQVGEGGLSMLVKDQSRSELLSRSELSEALQVDVLLLDFIFVRLRGYGLIQVVGGPAAAADSSDRVALSRLGYRFVRFIKKEWESRSPV